MSIHFADEDSAVFVTQPGSDRHEVDTGHHADRAEIMPKIMKADPIQTGSFPRNFQALAKTLRMLVARSALGRRKEPRAIGRTSSMHFAKECSQLRVKFDGANLAILRKPISTNCHAREFQIHVRPFNAQSLLFARATEGKKSQIIRQLLTVLFTGRFRGLNQPVELGRRDELSFWRRWLIEHFHSRKLAQITVVD